MVELIHTNICAPFFVPSMSSSRYFIIFTYDYNRCLRLATKARACKGVGQEGSLGITFHVLGNVKE
jgi:hypothetical protein